MKKQLFLGALAAIALTGCNAINTSGSTVAAGAEIEPVKYQAKITASDKAVSGEASVNCLFGIISWGVSNVADDAFVKQSGFSFALFPSANQLAKQGATYNALNTSKADILLAAKYVIETKDYFVFKTVKCTATGFPGVVTGIK